MIVVIDTNVLLVANQQHADVSEESVVECVKRLQSIKLSGVVVIDDGWEILNEYKKKTMPNQSKGVGDVFLKMLLQNSANSDKVQQVTISEVDGHFSEFPDVELQKQFDAADRKFVAVANAHPQKPAIWQAADCKWLDWWQALHAQGIKVDFLCPADVRTFYMRKFPGKAIPPFPYE